MGQYFSSTASSRVASLISIFCLLSCALGATCLLERSMDAATNDTVALFKSHTDPEDRYLSVLQDGHYCTMSVPTLAFRFLVDDLRECLLNPDHYSGLLFTSQRSVEAVKEALGVLPSEWKEMRHYCVGVQTHASAVKLLGLSRLLGQDCGNADSLSLLIVKEFQNGDKPLLFPCSNLRMDTIPRVLGEHNVPVRIVTSYVTVPHPLLEESIRLLFNDKKPKYLVFFSPSGVKYALPYLKQYELVSSARVISIGQTTARALAEKGIAVSQVCSQPTPEDLIEAIQSA